MRSVSDWQRSPSVVVLIRLLNASKMLLLLLQLLLLRTQRQTVQTDATRCSATSVINLGPDLQYISGQSYDCLTIMPKLRSTYDGHRIYKTSCEERRVFLRYDLLANLSDRWDSVRKLAYDVPNIKFSTFQVTTVSRSYDKLEIILR